MGIEVRLMQIQPYRKIQIELLRVRLTVEVLAYWSYYFLCLSFQFSMYFVISEIKVIWIIPFISNSKSEALLSLQKLDKHVRTFWKNSLHFKMQFFWESTFWNITKFLIYFFCFKKHFFANWKLKQTGIILHRSLSFFSYCSWRKYLKTFHYSNELLR